MMFHIGRWLGVPGLATNSYLAVDFFFCLSGFVLTLAYQRRFDSGMTTIHFMIVRLNRLMPLVVLATLISAVYVMLRSVVLHDSISFSELGIATSLGLLGIPFLGASESIGGPQVFPLNGPQYTLFLEFVVNFFWVATGGVRRLLPALAIAALGLSGILWFGILSGDIGETFLAGFPRVLFSFYLGVCVFYVDRHAGRTWRRDTLFWASCAVTVGIFFIPVTLPFPMQLLWVAILSPTIVFAGAGISLHPRVARPALLLGALSYPIYILHYPVFCWVNGIYQVVMKRPDALVESILLFVAVPVAGFIALQVFDEPVRRALNVRFSQRPQEA